jgi:hypothetical protein
MQPINADAGMNASATNANNALEVEATPLEKISGIIFDLGSDGKIPEGDYLNLMNHMKKLYEDMQKPVIRTNIVTQTVYRPAPSVNGEMTQPDRVRMTRHYESKLYLLRRIDLQMIDGMRTLTFHDQYLDLVRNNLIVGFVVRLLSTGKSYKFMKITKINGKSIKYDIMHITSGRFPSMKKNNKLSFRKDNIHENFSTFVTKQILFYDTSNNACNQLIDSFGINWGNVGIDNLLTIWN